MKLKNMNKKFYALCPANYETGGIELVHQFIDYINNIGKEGYIVYFDNNDNFIDAKIPDSYTSYNIRKSNSIPDIENSVVVLPEVCLYFSKKFNNTKFLFWWMSYDNYFENSGLIDFTSFAISTKLSFKKFLGKFYRHKSKRQFTFNDIKRINNRVIHGYQSQYVHNKLFNKGLFNQLPLSDYINKSYYNKDQTQRREDIILYNPAKGFEVTKKIIETVKDYQFIPLKGLNRDELRDLFTRAKLYIDFGNHPGKDRIPREAALQGCVILVGKKGSAKYFEDVLLNNDKKMDSNEIIKISSKIKHIMQNFENEHKSLSLYRDVILEEEKKFFSEIDFIINSFNFI
jgi:hypothetical protein